MTSELGSSRPPRAHTYYFYLKELKVSVLLITDTGNFISMQRGIYKVSINKQYHTKLTIGQYKH